MKNRSAIILVLVLASGFLYAQGRSTQNIGQVGEFSITNFPILGALAAQSDTVNFTAPSALRVNADGAVTVTCWGNPDANSITLTLAAGEFVPCQVKRLWDSGTDAITIHRFW
jgi:hypothetical protein